MPLPQMSMEGRVVADPELRFGASGIAVCRLRLVASSRKKTDSGEWVDDKTLWINATCFRQLAEHVAESVVKGDLVLVTGKVQTDEWQNEQGEKRSQTVLIADTVGASLAFRTVPHGTGQAQRSQGQPRDADPWSQPAQSDEPPF